MVRAKSSRNSRRVQILSTLVIVWGAVVSHAGVTGQSPESVSASKILAVAGLQGGVIVHLGCAGGRLTAALCASEHFVVQGLDSDPENVRQSRAYIQELSLCGPVSVRHLGDTHLPYVDNLVNLLVVSNESGVSESEMRRVLAPGGVVLFLDRQSPIEDRKLIKPRPGNTDEWTHYLHDPSGNSVAHDELVGPPRHLQWTAGPLHTRSHEHIPSIYSVVSTGGRIFYIADEAPVGALRKTPVWSLVARDAYNGLLLWKRSLASWFPHIVNWGATPRQLQRMLVAVGDRVYVTLGLGAPVTAVDAATGETLKNYDGTNGTEEIVCHQGTLLLVLRPFTEERTAEHARFAQLVRQEKSPLDDRDTAEPLVKRLRETDSKVKTIILAIDTETGTLLWEKTGAAVSRLRTLSLCASGDRVFYQNGTQVVCVDLRTGRDNWSVSTTPMRLVYNDRVICADGKTVTALSVDDGKRVWKEPTVLTQVHDVFVINGSIWVGGFKPFPKKRGPSWGPYFVSEHDLSTGRMLRHIEAENPEHHHRCYLNKATDRYILGGRRGTEFIDLESGEVLWNSWARGVCKYGVMPCNGLVYVPPHACACYMTAKLTGFNAMAAKGSRGESPESNAGSRLERGPAFGTTLHSQSSTPDSSWPTYRHDLQRSGFTAMPVPASLHVKWQTDVGDSISAPTVAEGRVLVSVTEKHKVTAINADSGESAWTFTTGSRVDSPPTLVAGRSLFGCRDGFVCSVQIEDGALVWRLRAARCDRQIVAHGQMESALPVLGSVLVQDGVAYCTAGRSSYLDGGIDVCRFDPETGKVLSTTNIYSPDSETEKQPTQSAPSAMPGARADILTGDGEYVYLRDTVLGPTGQTQTHHGNPHLFTMTDFLDDSWTHRSYWIFGTQCSVACGCSGRSKTLVYGRLLVFNEEKVFGYGRAGVHWSNQLQDGRYRVFSLRRDGSEAVWEKPVPIQVRAMILADKTLFVAGPPAHYAYGPSGDEGSQTALLVAFSAEDGTKLSEQTLDASPVFDGMAAANGRLYLSLANGRVVCLEGQQGSK